MPDNKYCNLVPTNLISAEYQKINDGFAGVEADVNAVDAKADGIDARVDTLITTPISGEAAAQELVDARGGKATLGDRFGGIDSQLADVATQINDLDANKADETYVDATNLRIDNLVIPISPENANIEVTDAHNSIVKNKNFASLKARLEESEQDYAQQINKQLQSSCIVYPRLPNGIINSFENGVFKERAQKHILTADDVENRDITFSNVSYVVVKKPADYVNYGIDESTAGTIYCPPFADEGSVSGDTADNIYKISSHSSNSWRFWVDKNAYASLTEAKAGFTGLEVIYQLATVNDVELPTEISPNAHEIVRLSELTGQLETQMDAYANATVETAVGEVIHLGKVLPTVARITSSTSVTICGKNIFDQSTKVAGKILNDSGVEITDSGSHYFSQLIPVNPFDKLSFNFIPQRLYYYGVGKNFIRRALVSSTTLTMPSDAYYIQVQCANTQDAVTTKQIEFGTVSTEYEKYIANVLGRTYPVCNISNADHSEITIEYSAIENAIEIPACGSFPLWEPTFTTSDYITPIGYSNIILAITSYQFLAQYFDVYVGKYSNGYHVSKKSLGRDSSNGYEIYEYDFIPPKYNRTIMISAGMNSCELSPMWGLAFFVKSLMENTEPGMQYIYENVRIKMMPVMCPWSFDQSPKAYTDYNDVRINKNFDYKGSWVGMTGYDALKRGTAPDTEAEVKILKKWLNDNSKEAELYIDCHSDVGGNTPKLNQVFTSHSGINATVISVMQAIQAYYVAKGTMSSEDPVDAYCITSQLANSYPKTVYSHEVCDIDAIMIEQYPNGTFYGGSETTNNDDADIRNYTLMIRAYILALLARNKLTFTEEDYLWRTYHEYLSTHGKVRPFVD